MLPLWVNFWRCNSKIVIIRSKKRYMGPVRLTLAWKMEQHYFHKLILCISHEFSQIMGHGEYGKVHIDLVFSCVTETSVVPVVFYLSENSLRFYWSPASVPHSFLRGQHLPCLALVLVEVVVHLYRPPLCP